MKLFINIKQLLKVDDSPKAFYSGEEMNNVKSIDNAYLIVEDEYIKDYGQMSNLDDKLLQNAEEIIDLEYKKFIIPGFVDSHTHAVFVASREMEFVDKIKGLTYQEIAAKGGGILNSAKKIKETSEEELYEISLQRIKKLIKTGTVALEIKSGYGLYPNEEIKMLRVINRLKENLPIEIVPTFLAAHAYPLEYLENKHKYIDLVINETLPAVASEKLAKYIDVFCEEKFFSVQDTEKILEAGQKYGLIPKIHANQLAVSGGVQVGVKFNALSVDHLENITDEEIFALKNTQTMPTILPGCALFLNLPLTPVRKMIKEGLPIAIASDFNPGTSPAGNMKLMMSLGCIRYKMLPNEALNAVTQNAAYAIGLNDKLGSITKGKLASFIITEPMPTFEYFPYSFSENLIESVYVKGRKINN